MDVGNGKALHELMAQMLGGHKVEEDNVVGKQDTEIKIDKNVKDQNQEAIDTANIIKSAPTREDPNKTELEKEYDVDGIADGILVVTDPEITSEEFEEVADELQGIVDNTEAGEVPFTDKYEGDYILSCPICGGTFVNDTLLDSGEDTCPICCKVPDSFVVNGRVENSESAVDKEEVQDDIEHKENLEEPMEDEQPIETQDNLDIEEGDEEEPMRKESKQLNGNKLQEKKVLTEDEVSDYLENEKALSKDYKERAKKSITEEARVAFNDLKDVIEEGGPKTLVDGFYLSEKAVNIIELSDKSHHLNKYMDLTTANIINMVEDADTIEEAIDTLFDDYKADSAFSWADNFITILGKLDFDVIDEDELEEYDDEDELYGYEESKKVTEDIDEDEDDMERQHQANLDMVEDYCGQLVSLIDNAQDNITFGGDFANLLKEFVNVVKDKASAIGYPINESKKLTEGDTYDKGIFYEIEQAFEEAGLNPSRFIDDGILTKNIGWTVTSSETGESQQISCDGSWYDEDDEDDELYENKKITEARDRVAENISKFVYDLTSDDFDTFGESAWSGNAPTFMGNTKVYEVYRNGKSNHTPEEVEKAVLEKFPELTVHGYSKGNPYSIFFCRKNKKESKKINEEKEELSYKDMSTEDLDAYMTDIINKREGTEDGTEAADYLDQLYMDVDNEIQRRKETEEKKITESEDSKVVWSSEPNYVTDPEDPDFKEWFEMNGYDEYLEDAEDDIEREKIIQDYLNVYNEDMNEVVGEDWNETVIPMIEGQLDDNDLIILLGKAQTWRGTGNAGKILRGTDELQSLVADYDIVEFEADNERALTMNLVHHDGTHRMNMFTFNGDVEGIYNKLIELGINEFSNDEYEDFDDAYSYYDAGDFIDYLMDGYQEELKEFLVPIRWE